MIFVVMPEMADEMLATCVERGRFDLIADYAQPYSVAVICSMLGVPRTDTQLLLDWSHAIVKMYELSTPDELKRAADDAAGAFIEYTREAVELTQNAKSVGADACLLVTPRPSPPTGAPGMLPAGCAACKTPTAVGASAATPTTTRSSRAQAPARPRRRPGPSWVFAPLVI